MKIEINNKKIEVRKLPIGRYAELIKKIQNIAGLALVIDAAADKEKRQLIMENFFSIAIESIDDIAMIIEMSTDVTQKEVVEEWGLADVYKTFEAILQVNDVDFLKKKVGKVLADLFQSTTGLKK